MKGLSKSRYTAFCQCPKNNSRWIKFFEWLLGHWRADEEHWHQGCRDTAEILVTSIYSNLLRNLISSRSKHFKLRILILWRSNYLQCSNNLKFSPFINISFFFSGSLLFFIFMILITFRQPIFVKNFCGSHSNIGWYPKPVGLPK